MSEGYEETLDGERLIRRPPGPRHERICARLHHAVGASVAGLASTNLLAPRTAVELSRQTNVRPDLALITTATSKLWLAAEIVNSEDHRPDTVLKKQAYEEVKLTRLWMIDPRYDNVEIYHASEYGLVLKQILAGNEAISETLLPGFQLIAADLFRDSAAR